MTGGRHFLGLDAGTSLTKAALFDIAGREIAVAEMPTAVGRPQPGWSEIDPEEAWAASVAVLRRVVAESGVDPRSIRGLGLSAAMVGAWVLDSAGKPLRPAITWEDSRAQQLIASHVAATPDFMSRIFASSGSVMQQGCTLPVVAWLALHEPSVLEQAAHVVSFKDYLRFRLTGRIGTDRTEAAVLPGSAVERDRSDAMIALFGLERRSHLFPAVEDSESVGGRLSSEAAALVGLPEGLPVAVGAGDVAATVVGAGELVAGTATAVLGTACMVGVIHDRPVFDPPDVGLLFTLPGNRWYRAMLNVAGTLNLDWAFATLAPDLAARDDRFAALDRMLDETPPGARGLTYLPYLSDSGIIAPIVDPSARAQFSGLTPRHDRACMFRAVVEGVAFAMLDLLEALSFNGDRLVLTGGGARNTRWTQMICDLVGRQVVVPEGTQFGARGAAWLAATATGDLPGILHAARGTAGDRMFEPDAAAAAALKPALIAYRAARDRLIGR